MTEREKLINEKLINAIREKLINEIVDRCCTVDTPAFDRFDFELDLDFLETETLRILSEGLDKK